jgi:hypothetical protein
MHDLDHPILASATHTNSWHARHGDLQRALPLDVPMVPTSVIIIALGTSSSLPTTSVASLSSSGGVIQALPWWAQLTVGHHPHGGP